MIPPYRDFVHKSLWGVVKGSPLFESVDVTVDRTIEEITERREGQSQETVTEEGQG